MLRYALYTPICFTLLCAHTTAQAATTPVFVNLGVTHNPNKTPTPRMNRWIRAGPSSPRSIATAAASGFLA